MLVRQEIRRGRRGASEQQGSTTVARLHTTGDLVASQRIESFSTDNEYDYEYEIWKLVLRSMRKVSNLVLRTRSTTSLK